MSFCTTTHFISPFISQPFKTPKTLTLIFHPKSFQFNKTPQFHPILMQAQKKPTRRKPYGSSRKSSLKKSFTQEQVVFSAPVSDDPEVGIIGGGMSGLICALFLEKRGVRSTVFDTGLRGLGGRMGTRFIEPKNFVFDHAAQFFTVTDPSFADLVNGWIEKGLVRQWHGTVGELEPGGQFVELPASPPRYIAVHGMRVLADTILSEANKVKVVRPCWISTLEPYNGMWHLSENGKPQGQFDTIVIAHNGKCANRLLASSGLPLIAKQMKTLELSSIWALLASFDDSLPMKYPFEGAFVKGMDALSWMGNNSAKLSSIECAPNCWTFFSTAAFGKKNKVPQENIPSVTTEKVTTQMLAAVESALGLSEGSLKKPLYSRVQLWGAALPTNTPAVPCIFDPQGRAGICGDWLLGSSLEAAALSGIAMANQISDFLQSGGTRPDEFAVGLQDEFQQIQGYDIGQFPGLEAQKEVNHVTV
ncbi:uncharacterized protein LOC141647217 [Silene latifolia]|uniref:uncharacterized protein LOC141647217 n=1 Tax=Silene latifolia TaxID=37657 RepID=UPI003D772546